MSLDLEALETSFNLIAPRGDELMDAFYARLFTVAPAVQPLFAGTDMARQKTMLLGALVLLRKSLRDLDAIVPEAARARVHATSRTAPGPSTTPSSVEVLIASMADIAGDAWRLEYSRAWAAAYQVVAGAMIAGGPRRGAGAGAALRARRLETPARGARGRQAPTPARRLPAPGRPRSVATRRDVSDAASQRERAHDEHGAGESELVCAGTDPSRGRAARASRSARAPSSSTGEPARGPTRRCSACDSDPCDADELRSRSPTPRHSRRAS